MDAFARCFLLVFAQLYGGGILALSIPPFHELERGFYKSSAAVYLGIGLLVFAGRVALLLRPSGTSGAVGVASIVELALLGISLLAAAIYLRSLWGEAYRLRARAYACAWMSALAALALGAQSFRLDPALSMQTLLYPLSFIVSALVLGSVTTGMLLGHWYLIDRNLSLEPFHRIFRFFVGVLLVQAILLLIDAGLLRWGAADTRAAVAQLFHEHAALLMVRLLLSPVGTAGLAWMIWRTLRIPQTMAATGLFYIAILSVLVGELMGRFILFRTSLPL